MEDVRRLQTRSGSGTQSSPGAGAGDSVSRELRARAGKCWATIRNCGDYCDDMMTTPVNTTHQSEVRGLTRHGRDKIEMSPAGRQKPTPGDGIRAVCLHNTVIDYYSVFTHCVN